MDTKQYKPMTQRAKLSALYHIRSDIVRGEQDGLEHVDWLIRSLGADPEARLIRRAYHMRFKRSGLKRAVLEVLQDGSATTRQIADRLGNHPNTIYSVGHVLQRLRGKGLVCVVSPRRGRTAQVWGLAP